MKYDWDIKKNTDKEYKQILCATYRTYTFMTLQEISDITQKSSAYISKWHKYYCNNSVNFELFDKALREVLMVVNKIKN